MSKQRINITVTWIPAEELPKKDRDDQSVEVLAYTNQDFLLKARYDYRYKEWYITEGEDSDNGLCFNEGEKVIYYMYYPQAPKK